ncbi:MAG: glutamine synthetase III [Rhizobacter sp.]|nr:glutamine synthetase III [Chlorobiales bacterium]
MTTQVSTNGNGAVKSATLYFGSNTFNTSVMQSKLPKEIFNSLKTTLDLGEKLSPDIADAVAHAMKEWALEHGATHYCHWFQPMTGATAEKHDAFLSFDKDGSVIDRFSGSQLIQSEPDASSFPSGGMRATFEARGYTAWDPSSPAFLMEGPQGITMCIPSVFISYHGEALDEKAPLLRSMAALSKSATAMLHLLGKKNVTHVTTYLGAEQEYFLVDRELYEQRPDLMLTGRTLIGNLPPKGQQLEDHYFGSIPDRVLDFMQETEKELYKLGIPAKTRHNEVAPHQFEIAPIHEVTSLAADHNLLTMETMRKVAERKGLALLLHEKPFAGINGSGKHNNWSMGDSTGKNLLDPGETPESNLNFIVFLVATLKGVHKRAAVLRAAIASAGNDHRLGANEAPPAIMSVFLGEQLDAVLNAIERGEVKEASAQQFIELGVSQLPAVSKDNTDRNRTSPFAFTGNKFEFRAVPSSMPIAIPNSILNTAMSEAIDDMREAIEAEMKQGKALDAAALEVVRKEVKATKAIRFEGDGYSEAWQKEAKKRGLPNLKNTPEALAIWNDQSTRDVFTKYGVLTAEEIDSRYHVRLERYVKDVDIEIKSLLLMIKTQVLPACVSFQGEMAGSFSELVAVNKSLKLPAKAIATQAAALKSLATNISLLMERTEKLEASLAGLHKGGLEAHAKHCANVLLPSALAVREVADALEMQVDKDYWPVPSYLDLLFKM